MFAALIIIVVAVGLVSTSRLGAYESITINQSTSSTIIYLTSTKYTTTIMPANSSQQNTSVTKSAIIGCSSCYALFIYNVSDGDTLSSIANNYGLPPDSIGQFNNITSVYPGEEIYLPFYVDTIKTSMPFLLQQNGYDSYILMYSVQFHLNPMLIKAQVYDESEFNSTGISEYDSPPGVCGTGHSYGLLQYTPTCFVYVTNFGTSNNYTANAQVLYGQRNGPALINCTTQCSAGDYFVNEYSAISGSTITSDLIQNSKYPGWNNSVFNPSMNLFAVMQIEHMDIEAMISNGYSCTYAQYNEMALAQYQQSVSQVVFGCDRVSGGYQYINSVLQDYSQLAASSVYGWNDEYQ